MYYYYCYGGSHTHRENIHNISFRKVSPRINSIHNILWHICSWVCGSCFYEYQIVNGGGKVLSTAQVCPKLPIFTFFKKGYHIGPCMTIKEERGKGFYPLLLQYIIDEHPERKYYMIVDEHNIPSQRGIEKMNFVKFAKGKKDRLGRYVIL